MAITRQKVERQFRETLELDEEMRDLLRQGGYAGVLRFAQVVHSCVDKLNAEAGLTGPRARFVASEVLHHSLPSMLLLREGDVRAASQAISRTWMALSTGELAEPVRLPERILARHGEERALEELVQMFPMAIYEETASARKESDGREILRRLMAYLDLSFDDIGRVLDVSGETVRRWERGVSRIPLGTLATLELADGGLARLVKLLLPQRLPEVVRRKADLFDGDRALDWILRGRLADVADRYEQALTYQG